MKICLNGNLFYMEHLILIAEEGERDLIAKYLPNTDWPVLVTGVGGVNIVRALRDVPKDTHVLNIGYAGSANFNIGTVVEVTEVFTNHPNCRFAEPTLKLNPVDDGLFPIADRKAVCYTNSDFVLASDYKDCVFDMELAYIAAMGFAKTSALKLVSDNLSLHAYHELTNGVE
ncbi:MAG: hypothetical protein KBS40_06480 [Bacteroidales bacterium]|nr:hypothetical protein [Bacteroidales bacterium]